MKIKIVTFMWEPDEHSFSFSRMYDETWVDKLYRGFKRNLTEDFDFILICDKDREFEEDIIQIPFIGKPSYAATTQGYKFNEPSILVGLDTVVTGNCDHLVEYCMTADKIALPRDPYYPEKQCNGVVLIPAGMSDIYNKHNGENDMDWINTQPHNIIDDIWPNQVVSYKKNVLHGALNDARIVYFHGKMKPDSLSEREPWINTHWV